MMRILLHRGLISSVAALLINWAVSVRLPHPRAPSVKGWWSRLVGSSTLGCRVAFRARMGGGSCHCWWWGFIHNSESSALSFHLNGLDSFLP